MILGFIILCLLIFIDCGEKAGDIDSLKFAAESALESGDFNKAVNLFKDALKEKPSDRDLLFGLGISFKRLDMIDSALVYFRRAKILYRRDRVVNQELLELCPLVNDYECALNAIAVMVATGDNEKIYWPRLAEFHYRIEDLNMAVKYFRLILDDDPDKKNTYLYLSGSLARLGKYDESNNIIDKSLERFGPSEEAYANLAVNYINMKMPGRAEEYFRKSLVLNPDNIPVWINLANLISGQESRKKKEEALEIYKRYHEETPEFYNLDSIISALEVELSQE